MSYTYNRSTLAADRREARKLKALTDLEEQTYKQTIEALEAQIEEHDKNIKQLTKEIHTPQFYSAPQLRAKRKLRTSLKKTRNNLQTKLDLLRK